MQWSPSNWEADAVYRLRDDKRRKQIRRGGGPSVTRLAMHASSSSAGSSSWRWPGRGTPRELRLSRQGLLKMTARLGIEVRTLGTGGDR
jgi:hypothetical protein